MAKKIIYLSLKDLKELGIIKKRRKRKSRRKAIPKNTFAATKPTSAASNIFGSVQYSNTSNLNTENIREQNRALMLSNDSKEVAIKNDNSTSNDVNNKLLQLERQQFNQQNNYFHLTGKLAETVAEYNINRDKGNQGYTVDDNVDVPSTGGSDSFFGEGTTETVQDVEQEPQTPQDVKSVESVPQTPEPEVEAPIQTQPSKKQKIEENRIKLRNELKALGVSGAILDSKNQAEMASVIKSEKREITTLKGIYTDLGGTNNKILTSKNKEDIKTQIDKLKNKKNKKI